jgi:hypothetical protein
MPEWLIFDFILDKSRQGVINSSYFNLEKGVRCMFNQVSVLVNNLVAWARLP